NSEAYETLSEAFKEFNQGFKNEQDSEGLSIEKLVTDINKEIDPWNVSFGFEINSIQPKQIVKRLLSHYIKDENLDEERVAINSFGQGLQRHLIYTLILLSANYKEQKKSKKKEFDPNFTLLLFEEPEAFLHPSQQERLNFSLKE